VSSRGVEEAAVSVVRDPVAWISEVLRDPETGRPYELCPAQERWLREALTLTEDGRLPYPELVFGAIKKSGKTGLAAMVMLYVVTVLGGPYADGYCLANDEEQAQGRVFRASARIAEASPLLRRSAKVTQNVVEFPSTGRRSRRWRPTMRVRQAPIPRWSVLTSSGRTCRRGRAGFGTR
jgi:hypothetical protein